MLRVGAVVTLFTVPGCFAEPEATSGDGTGDGASDGDTDDGGDGTDAAGDADDDSPDADSGSDGEDTEEDDEGDDDGSDDDGVDAEYPPEVTEILDLPFPPPNYADPALPDHFEVPAVEAMDNTPPNNAITNDGATLGRVLFYDTLLSANETKACASCHHQDLGFTDDATFSEGFEGGQTGRNSMQIANARWYDNGRFFWDERAETLEAQVLMPIQDAVEMGLSIPMLVERVSAQPYYPPLFERAFGDDTVDAERISFALAQFVRSIVSYRSRFDEGLAQAGDPTAPFANFNAEENQGKAIFFGPQGGCAACHVGNGGPPPAPGMPPGNVAIFQPTEATNNGLDAELSGEDNGVGDQTEVPADNGLFKVPTLRNIALTGPYMHDGRFGTLAEVIEHYDVAVQPHPNLDPRLTAGGGQPRRLNLTPDDRAALAAFLGTLTDEALLDDPKFADPFR